MTSRLVNSGRESVFRHRTAMSTHARDVVGRLVGGWRASLALSGILGLLATAGVATLAPVGALAGSMHVYGCQTPAQRSAPTDGWSGSVVGSFVYAINACPTNGLQVEIGNANQPANATSATWAFSATAGMTVSGARLYVGGSNRGSQGSGTETVFDVTAPNNAYDSADVVYQCPEIGCGKTSTRVIQVPQANLLGATHLYLTVFCGGSAGQSCPAFPTGQDPLAIAWLLRSDITLFQTSQPTVSNVSGSLLAPGVLRGTQNILFTAYDQASGIYQAIFDVDGHPVSTQVINSNGGRCQNVGGTTDGTFAFLYTQPCPQQVTGDLSIDTSQIADGTHRLKVLVQNAAGDTAVAADTTITVENHPLLSEYTPPTDGGMMGGNRALGALSGGQSASDIGACNGTVCDEQAKIQLGTARRASTTYKGSAFRLTGRLSSRTGAPIAGAQIDLLQRPTAIGYGLRLVGTTTTAADGSWALAVPRGPSRLLQVAYRAHVGDQGYAVHVNVAERVKAPVTLKAPRHAHAGVPIVFHGSLAGGYIPAGGGLISLEIYYGGQWRTFATARTGTGGAFNYRYVFALGYGPATYRFRASVLGTSDYPFLSANSPGLRVSVR